MLGEEWHVWWRVTAAQMLDDNGCVSLGLCQVNLPRVNHPWQQQKNSASDALCRQPVRL
jgi:hypothetical protein